MLQIPNEFHKELYWLTGACATRDETRGLQNIEIRTGGLISATDGRILCRYASDNKKLFKPGIYKVAVRTKKQVILELLPKETTYPDTDRIVPNTYESAHFKEFSMQIDTTNHRVHFFPDIIRALPEDRGLSYLLFESYFKSAPFDIVDIFIPRNTGASLLGLKADNGCSGVIMLLKKLGEY